ncbi:MAG TPA: hypothetical protein EYP65_05750, partial [Armatimonadetes bacterium]|nr:hypothetical protein [Armatimonadota bacterium]
MARFETTVARLKGQKAFEVAVAEGAREVVEGEEPIALYAEFLRRFGHKVEEAVAIQMKGLPERLKWGAAQYLAPEIARR